MNIDARLMAFLRGEQFSNGVTAQFTMQARDYQLRSRIDWLRELCAQKHIVHVGCVDHDIAMVRDKMKRGKWLHQHLMEVSTRVLGVDIDAVGIEQLRIELGIDDLLAADLLSDPCEEISTQSWNIMLLAEVLEHIGNPVQFLSRLVERFGNNCDEFVITVPNGFAEEIVRAARNGQELINSDHRFWFTPYTIAKVCIDAGLEPIDITLCRNGVIKRRSVLKNRRLSKHPFMRNNIIVRARISK